MPKRYISVVVFTGLMAIVALFGYSIPGDVAGAVPTRIRFDNAGGKVVFDHKKHAADYAVPCERCHHESATPRENVKPCGTCHGVTFDDAFRKNHAAAINDGASCVTCHHSEYAAAKWDHDAHAQGYSPSCTDYHHDTSIEPTPTNCADCHSDGKNGASPDRKTAVHTRCAPCHADMFDAGVKGCASCHPFTDTRARFASTKEAVVGPGSASCQTCHADQKLKDLVPGRMAAFHGQCMSCHEKEGKGPFKKDQCQQCHLK